ncbi:MAG: hypothetical protein M3R71_01270 [Actinomycetota bacterium]|nr:hypothetical protein [Actinomycetota bacterium]
MTETQALQTHPVEPLVAAWRAELAGQVSVPASQVQDHLLDLWGLLDEGDTRREVEAWLTETLERNLYVVADLDTRVEQVFALS